MTNPPAQPMFAEILLPAAGKSSPLSCGSPEMRIARRDLLGLTTIASLGIPSLAHAINQPLQSSEVGSSGKSAVRIPDDNAIFGVSTASFEKYGYSPAVRARGRLHIAGQVGIRPDGSVPRSAAEQAELAMRRTAEILRLEGLSLSNLVEVTSYHVDLESNVAAFLPVKARYSRRPFSAWSIIGIEALARTELLVEIKSVAVYSG